MQINWLISIWGQHWYLIGSIWCKHIVKKFFAYAVLGLLLNVTLNQTITDSHYCLKSVPFGAFLVRIFPHLDWIRKDMEYLSVFRPNAEKCGPEKLRIGNFSCSAYWQSIVIIYLGIETQLKWALSFLWMKIYKKGKKQCLKYFLWWSSLNTM